MAKCGAMLMPLKLARLMICKNGVIPPTRGASGWMKSQALALSNWLCSPKLVSISPVAIAVSSEAARAAWPSTS
ncbi:hypothetical protein D3C80_2095420 [compost metagenome]